MATYRAPCKYVNLCVMQYAIELEKVQMEDGITATAISYRMAQYFNSAATDIIKFAKTPEERSNMLEYFSSEIRKLDAPNEYEIAQLMQSELIERDKLLRAIYDSADWKAISTK